MAQTIGKDLPNLTVERIDPKVETDLYVTTVLEKNSGTLSADDMALLEEEMRSPCIEEIAVFQAFIVNCWKPWPMRYGNRSIPVGWTIKQEERSIHGIDDIGK